MRHLSFKITTLLILFYSWCPQYSFSQNSPADNPRKYLYNNNKTIVWEDHFQDDKNGWLTQEDTTKEWDYDATIAEGYLKYKNNDPETITAVAAKPEIDFSRDFEIEYSSRMITAPHKNNAASVLFWTRESRNHGCYLYYFKKGRINYIAFDTTNNTKLRTSRYSRHIKEKEFNKVTVRKTKGTIYLFINERYTGKLKYLPLYNKIIGLGAGPDAEIWFDYIRISYLEPNASLMSIK